MLNRIGLYVKKMWIRRNSESLLNYYRSQGIKIGQGTISRDPMSLEIDISRPSLVDIGENVLLHKGLKILTHDFASRVFVNLYGEFVPSHGRIKIGNNVWFGQDCTILKGVKIGDNCIIGLRSVVVNDIPDNCVAVGAPAKVICSLEEYYEKRKRQYFLEVIDYAKSIRERFDREVTIYDFLDDYPCFVDGSNYKDYPMIDFTRVFKGSSFRKWKEEHKAI